MNLEWQGNRTPWMIRERRRILGRSIVTGLLIVAALTWGISG